MSLSIPELTFPVKNFFDKYKKGRLYLAAHLPEHFELLISAEIQSDSQPPLPPPTGSRRFLVEQEVYIQLPYLQRRTHRA